MNDEKQRESTHIKNIHPHDQSIIIHVTNQAIHWQI